MKQEIITDRIILKSLELADAQHLHHVRTHPVVNRYIDRDHAKSLADTQAHITRVTADAGKAVHFTIRSRGDMAFIGTICLWNMDPGQRYAELGYELLPQYEGQGFMSAAVREMLALAFNGLGLVHIEAYTHHANARSRKLLERSGFTVVVGKTDEGNANNVIYELRKAVSPLSANGAA